MTAPPLVWVTGSTSGIGLATVERLLQNGWQVLGWDRAEPAIAVPGYRHVRVDLTDFAALHSALTTELQTGTPRALIHAAGSMHAAALGQLDLATGQHLWALHVQAITLIANAVLPAMQTAGGGRVVLIGSRIASGMAGRSQYAASKAALASLARSWASEMAAFAVTVNVVSPAATDTPMLRDPARAGSTPRLPPIGRLIQPQEVAALVAFLLGSEAAAITGQDIAVCGGASVRG